MKLLNPLYQIKHQHFVKKMFRKLIIYGVLSVFTFIVIVNPSLVRADAVPHDLEQLILGKKMVNMETRIENEYAKYFDRQIIEDTNQVTTQEYPNPTIQPNIPSGYNSGNIRRRNRNRNNRPALKAKNSSEMIKDLAVLDEKTGTRSGVLWVMPKDKFLHLVLLTTKGEITVKDIPNLPVEKLSQTVKDFYLEINSLSSPMDLTIAQQLYQWIIAPIEDEVLIPEKIDNLLFCLGKGVRSLPFAAMHDGEKFAIEKYSMSRIPAFNLINTTYKALREPTILAMGASDFTEEEPLPAVSLELQSIVDRTQPETQSESTIPMGNNQGEILFNQDFTFPNMEKQLKNKSFDIIHFATHADFSPGSPDNSYIQLWDEKLTLDRMSNFPWQNPPELLVLSACNTALGDEQAELGFTGIALQSGVKSALGSLWYISDLGTYALVTEFYEQLINEGEANPTKTQALSKAQNLLLEGKIYFEDDRLITPHGEFKLPDNLAIDGNLDLSHPFYWASFTLISSPW